MEFSSIKCLSRLESGQSKLLVLTHPYLWAGWEGGEGNPQTNVKAAGQLVPWPSCPWGRPTPGDTGSEERCGNEQTMDGLSMASLFGSRPEWSHGLHKSLAEGCSQAEARGFQQCIIIFDFSVCSAAFMWWGRQQGRRRSRIQTHCHLLFPSAEQTAPNTSLWPGNYNRHSGPIWGRGLPAARSWPKKARDCPKVRPLARCIWALWVARRWGPDCWQCLLLFALLAVRPAAASSDCADHSCRPCPSRKAVFQVLCLANQCPFLSMPSPLYWYQVGHAGILGMRK